MMQTTIFAALYIIATHIATTLVYIAVHDMTIAN